ncbi:MAG TPA: hypothetical protein VID29_01445 [Solirubrobacteraceae bacterium]|jgi:hypothetical protein
MPDPQRQPPPIAPSASPEQAAAVVAAVQRFMRDTAPTAGPPMAQLDPWTRTALLEGVGHQPNEHGSWVENT